ncbi:MAG: hypothetical protein LW724_02060 [Planctomycetaceae bacterium]|jgi:hypothetical protein|nr:hypothetical protein [Planctomycetaceae bacterium]
MNDSSINPYEPPSTESQIGIDIQGQLPEQSIEQIRRRVSRPGMALMIMGSIASVFPAVNIVYFTYYLLTQGLDFGLKQYNPIIPAILVNGVFFMIWLLISIGGAKMAFLESYSLARVAALLACIPIITPFIIIGIPFGIWGLILLNDPRVKAAYESVARDKR